MLRFVYPIVLYIGIPLLGLVALWRWLYHKKPYYIFSSTQLLHHAQTAATRIYDHLIFLLRTTAVFSLIFALARLQSADQRSQMPVEGVDIMLVLDISDSMRSFDDLKDTRQRIEVAREEALKFIDKRTNDPMGLVLFAHGIVSRCPLTLDKNILQQLMRETTIGLVNPSGTYLSWGIVAAANRLKESHAKSKIMIVLTDGEPSPGDINPEFAIDLVKKLGIKIYTIGIGSESGGFMQHPFFGVTRVPYKLNTELLEKFAQETHGQFFLAQNAQDMERIYTTIDKLERTEHNLQYARYTDYFVYFLWLAFLCLCIELFLSCVVWVSL